MELGTDACFKDPGRQPRRDRPAGHPRLPGARASRSSPSTPRPTAAPPTSNWPTRPSASATPPPAESYLNIPRIIAAAEVADVQAIHPGYGFLSENAHFAEVCRELQDRVHRPARTRRCASSGNKNEAQAARRRRPRCPSCPAPTGSIDSDDEALQARPRRSATRCSSRRRPAAAARGMRVARNDVSLAAGLTGRQARGRGRVQGRQRLPREVHRAAAARRGADPRPTARQRRPLWERDCSLQRRHQKLVEESPAPNLPAEGPRRASCEAAVRLAKAAGYDNAGTCEFLVDKDNNFYFIEVNARIQVEHPVTELVTGIDLVKRADPHRRRRDAAVHAGGHRRSAAHAIECRINAEDPANDFRPSPGHDHDAGSRRAARACGSDSHVEAGYRVPPNYDSHGGKLIVHQPTRAEAHRRDAAGLGEFVVEGIQTTIPLHQRDLRHAGFIEGQVDTTFIERVLMPPKKT